VQQKIINYLKEINTGKLCCVDIACMLKKHSNCWLKNVVIATSARALKKSWNDRIKEDY